ncbi:hypothetical protein LMG26411_01148 [Cupriavidus numazuensis]|uniref:Uncharacterized protein n=1 Tax=Cupriavidus numazuensis TaxID=221992 RepID=A0ABM8TCD9_9BURK|nr:hypothetical protein LMG26411_01148 [Cupriavidus numazuensis]
MLLSKRPNAGHPRIHTLLDELKGVFKRSPRLAIRVINIELTDFAEAEDLTGRSWITTLNLRLLFAIHHKNQVCLTGQHAGELLGTMRRDINASLGGKLDGRSISRLAYQCAKSG